MKIFYTDTFPIPIPETHSFPKDKYFLLRKRILEQLGDRTVDYRVPKPASDQDILRVHDPEYIRRLVKGELTAKEIRRVGLPVAVTMGGGYAPNIRVIVDIHFQTILSALEFNKIWVSRKIKLEE
jgi:acetoin utilization deacetylase AcuC-like enzyme